VSRGSVRDQEEPAHPPGVIAPRSNLAKLTKQVLKKLDGFPPKTVDPTGRGELAEKLMCQPSGALIIA
jgi:hypothetical protein